jgi:small-conductance mechanosensitive channel
MSPSHRSEPDAEKAVIKAVSTNAWRLLMLGMQIVTVGFFALCCWQGKNMLFSAVAQAPAVLANTEGVKEAASVAAEAKSTADATATRVEQVATAQGRIFDALKETNAAIDSLRVTVTASSSTVTAQVTDIGNRLTRIENRQDATQQAPR